MISYNDTNDDKIKRIYDIVGIEKFLELTEAAQGSVYIPQKNRFIRKIISEEPDLFLEALNKINSIQEAAQKFKVTTKTIRNWILLAFNTKKQKRKGRSEDADKLARAIL